MRGLLAYTPIVDPITEWSQGIVDAWWVTLPLLALGTAMAYKAVRLTDLKHYPRAVVVMAVQVTLAMVAIGVVIGLVAEFVVPFFGG